MAASAPRFEPYTAAFAADPYPVYAGLRATAPVFRSDELGMVFVTRYRDVFRALTDRRLGREPVPRRADGPPARRGALAPTAASPAPDDLTCYDRYVRVNLLETEGESHARLRRLLAGALSPQRIEHLAARVEEIARELVASLEPGREVDFIAAVAEPLPVAVISELFGWPVEERHRLRPWANDIVRLYEKDATAADRQRAETACREFAGALESLLEERRRRPRGDLASALALKIDEPGGLSRDEAIANAMLVLNAGHEATVNAAGNGLLALLRHDGARERLTREPALVGSAVEEILRFDAPLHLFHRYAGEDLTIGGVEVVRGETVGLLYGSANRDPEAFAEPDRFEVARSPNRHLAFGAATHFCLGAPLARLELRTLFAELAGKLPSMELAGQPEYRTGLVFRGLKDLRVR